MRISVGILRFMTAAQKLFSFFHQGTLSILRLINHRAFMLIGLVDMTQPREFVSFVSLGGGGVSKPLPPPKKNTGRGGQLRPSKEKAQSKPQLKLRRTTQNCFICSRIGKNRGQNDRLI